MSREGNKSQWMIPYIALRLILYRGNPNSVTGPVISVGFTDSVYARAKGGSCLWFSAHNLSAEEMEGFHMEKMNVSAKRDGKGYF